MIPRRECFPNVVWVWRGRWTLTRNWLLMMSFLISMMLLTASLATTESPAMMGLGVDVLKLPTMVLRSSATLVMKTLLLGSTVS